MKYILKNQQTMTRETSKQASVNRIIIIKQPKHFPYSSAPPHSVNKQQLTFFITRKRSYGKVMFSQACVCSQVGVTLVPSHHTQLPRSLGPYPPSCSDFSYITVLFPLFTNFTHSFPFFAANTAIYVLVAFSSCF